MSPRVKSRCSRSSNSLIVRIVRYASSSCSRSSGNGLSAIVSPFVSVLLAEQAVGGGEVQAAAHVDAAEGVQAQRHRDALAGADLELALAVEGDDTGAVRHRN